MARVRSLMQRARSWALALPVLRQDSLLYLVAAGFAAGEALFGGSADYREWGEAALAPYLVAASICEIVYRLRLAPRRRGLDRQWAYEPETPPSPGGGAADLEGGARSRGASRFRAAMVFGVFVFAVLVPLGQQVTWRAEARTTGHPAAQAQPEVATIERAGDRLASWQDPYLSSPRTPGVGPGSDSKSVDANSFFPYLPGMVLLGLLNAAKLPAELTDARVELAGSTLIVVALALFLVPAPRRRKWRAFQFLVVLPTGALPLVTGGDDLPVLALLLLGLVFVLRRQPVLAGVFMGLAGTLKWTAWPLIVLTVLCVRDEEDRPAMLRYSLSMLLVVVPVVGSGVLLGPHAFFENVVLFPLGLTKVHSPAASPLFGQTLVQLLPAYKKELTVALVGGATVVVLAALCKHPPKTASEVARFVAYALAFATIVAPATRFGYFIYPVNMLVWAYLLKGPGAKPRSRDGGEIDDAEESGDGVVAAGTSELRRLVSSRSSG